MQSQIPLFVPPAPAVGEIPFASDKFGRASVASALTGYIGRLKSGAVLAVDGGWGEGKSWFALNWKLALEEDGHTVLYIDAFEADYMEDPFLLLAGEIADLAKTASVKSNFIEGAKNVAITIAPTALKLAVRGAGKVFLGTDGLDEKIVEGAKKAFDGAEDALGKVLEKKINNYKEERKSIPEFRKSLQALAGDLENPLVIMVDELDRCKPAFAVKLLERIKHFFNVQNVVFVLFMHKGQMHNAIRGVYGQGTNAHIYLEKFLHFTFFLDRPKSGEIRPFIEAEIAKYQISISDQVEEFIETLCQLADVFAITARQVERAIALLALATPLPTAAVLLAELIVLKLSRPDLLEGILEKNHTKMEELENIISAQQNRNIERNSSSFQLEFLLDVQRALLGEEGGEGDKKLRDTYRLSLTKVKRDLFAVAKLMNIVHR